MKKSLLLMVVSLIAAAFVPTFGQEMPSPPRVLAITREEIKPGMMPAHTRHSATYAGIFRKLQTPNHRIAMVPVAGNQNEVLYVTPTESFAQVEKIFTDTDKKLSGVSGPVRAQLDWLETKEPELHAAMRDMLVVYRPEMSFNPGVEIAKMRYFSITTIRVRPGHDAQYVDYIQKMINVARQKAKADNLHIAVFQVVSGGPAGTYMAFRPMKSLAEMDDPIGMRVRAAMGDDQRKDADKIAGEAIMSSETSTYMFVPRMSYVPSDMTARDPFWNPPPEAAPKPKPTPRRRPRPVAPPPPTD